MPSLPATYYRPELHVTAETGVLEAPAAILLDSSTWHLFYQYRPDPQSPSRWGHQISRGDAYSWDQCDDALAPQGAEERVRAGSVAAIDGGVNLYFTSVTPTGTEIHLARIDDLEACCSDISDDPLSLCPAVQRVGRVVGDTDGLYNFRSPCVVADWVANDDRSEGHEGWLMLAVTGDVDSPDLAMLHSDDGKEWQLHGPLRFEGDTGLEPQASIVSPRITRLRDEVTGHIRDILLITVERNGVDISGYVVGHLEGPTFTVVSPFTRIDYGHDFTRPRNTTFTPGTIPEEQRYDRAAIMGLLNGIGRLDDPTTHPSLDTEEWANAVSLPRVTTLQDGVLYQTPTSKLPDHVGRTQRAHLWTGLCDIPQGGQVLVKLLDASGATAATICHTGDELTIDRSMNPHHRGDAPARAPLADGDSDSLTIIADGSTLEVFADGGLVAMASRVYVDGGCHGFDVTATGGAELINSFERWNGGLAG
ncbi:GH32 C-terminal domain-containing protein [Corynebacterium uberis]|uniref:GH32 C-terminal domain-containing protein n=1 Tax=Corynebacterium TaxID=1716 RepID=UPI001D0A0EF2|nr:MULTISPECIES: GH32 C-terminal domain-containing protein [Corynebacterium]MCZ9308963.1 GH32 C-terminal domain-containing protein [Corynebacterium sp. c6VSa_13]UDL74566.1 GH32 C-terminal domain-containing protein [Corynebacterium uberis]UDL76600.1 GH32 C-terminal domain-containing protein [Corynebacterium uberis]UDL78813.1 GH32 C-terminal domain-containing protein [Corynebacterium uberis]UDL81091.1 GH32 C-terminal domain-containing protein [Corynebacterium uberis]